VKRLLTLSAGSVGATAISIALFGTGVAAADEYDGQTYADAAAAIEESGGTPIVSTRVCGKLPQDECIGVDSADHSFMRPMTGDVYFEPSSDEVRLSLNCNGGYATAIDPGASLLSPASREAKAAADEAAAAEEQQLEEVSTPDEYGLIEPDVFSASAGPSQQKKPTSRFASPSTAGAMLRFCGADDGNRTRVFGLGS
jgi:hypothetical protein